VFIAVSQGIAVNRKPGTSFSRRQFARRAAVASAAVAVAPAGALFPSAIPQTPPELPKLSSEGQAEADSRYQQILALYGGRFDEGQKATIKKMCADLQPTLEKIRKFSLENGNAPALFLKPLVERDKKPQATFKKL
jgi:hypothetical protein